MDPIPPLPGAATSGPMPQTLPHSGPLPPPPPPVAPLAPAAIDSSDKVLAVLCHLSVFFAMYFLLPLVVFLLKKDSSPFVGLHAREVLNFHLSLLIYGICAIPLVFVVIGIPILIVLGLAAFICAIIGAIKAAAGEIYYYPLTIRFLG